VCVFVLGVGGGMNGWSQTAGSASDAAHRAAAAPGASGSPAAQTPSSAGRNSLAQWSGLPVRSISFAGDAVSRLAPLPGHLAQGEGKQLSPENLKKSLRQLYATGLFETIEVEGSHQQDGVALVFRGTPRT